MILLTNDEIYALFLDETNEIFGFASIERLYKYRRPEINQMKQNFYAEYDKDSHEIYKIILKKRRTYVGKKITIALTGRKCPPNTQAKRTESIRKFWEENKDTEYGLALKEISRKSMQKLIDDGKTQTPEVIKKRTENRLRNCGGRLTPEHRKKIALGNTGKIVSDETRKRQSEVALARFATGWRPPKRVVSEETKKLLSENTKRQWETGVFSKTKHLFGSKGQDDVFRIVKDFIYPEDYVDGNLIKFGKSWDIVIEFKNTIIEYNGSYWHFDPRFYEEDHYDAHRNLLVSDVWESDNEKYSRAIDNGYKFYIIWQYDWELLESDESKIEFITNLLND